MTGAYAWPLKFSGTSGDAGDSDTARFTAPLNLLYGKSSATSPSAPAPLEVPVVMGWRLKVPVESLAAKLAPFSSTTSAATTLAPPTKRPQEGWREEKKRYGHAFRERNEKWKVSRKLNIRQKRARAR
jgi:hypothetical protein